MLADTAQQRMDHIGRNCRKAFLKQQAANAKRYRTQQARYKRRVNRAQYMATTATFQMGERIGDRMLYQGKPDIILPCKVPQYVEYALRGIQRSMDGWVY